MLGAGVAVLKNGPAQLRRFTDPTTGGVFTYLPMEDGGFELRSVFRFDAKPVTLTFPPPKR